jgi:hypothetical protein
VKHSVFLALVIGCAPALAGKAYAQGTLVFNNLGTNNGLVFINRGNGGLMIPLNQDLNFVLLAGRSGDELQPIHVWLLSNGSAKGINVAPGRFADPSGGAYLVPGVAPGEAATIQVIAWTGAYDFPVASTASGQSPGFSMSTGRPGAPPSS